MRYEYKFLVPNSKLSELRLQLLPFMTPDAYADKQPNHHYTVRSIYFDTIRLDDYLEKCEGVKIRKKIRLRGYNAAHHKNVVYLEIKKKYENAIEKFRSQTRYDQVENILRNESNGDASFLSNPVDDNRTRFLYHIRRSALKPVVLVTYEREAYFCRFNDRLRVTFDVNLRSMLYPGIGDLFSESDLQSSMRAHFILEIKFSTGYPVWLQSVIERHGLTRLALSKYALCLRSHGIDQELPRGLSSVYAHTF